ncbi:MAG TPA: kelch repeat-containing protein [Candidatus Sulfotelmatobacter sp.]|nr:kelch repeat-containing protein [Candidatus Sulfotelmatobacter sp.]
MGFRCFTVLAVLGVLTACGGTGASRAAVPVSPSPASGGAAPLGRATFTIVVPARDDVSRARRAAYVSSATESLAFTLDTASGLTPGQVSAFGVQTFNVTPGSGNCPGSSPWTCTFTAVFPIGTDKVTLVAYDQAGGAGNALSQQTQTIAVVEGNGNSFAVALDAQVGTTTCPGPAIAISSLPSGTSGGLCSGSGQGAVALSSSGAAVFPIDLTTIDGTAIAASSPGAPKLSATQSGGVVSVSVSQNPYQLSLTPTGSGTGTVTLTASGASSGDGVAQRSITFSVEYPPFWSDVSTVPTVRENLAAGTINNIIYVVGGMLTAYADSNANEAYNPSTNTWTEEATMPTTREGMGVGVVNGILYAVGGFNTSYTILTTVEAYDPSSNTWSTKASLPQAVSGAGVGVVNGILYVVGGGNSSGPVNYVQAYNPSTNAWTMEAALPTARESVAVAVANNTLYAIGGDNGNYLTTVEAYNPSNNTWATEASMPGQGRESVAVGVVNNTIYEAGGDNYNQGWLTTAAAYNPTSNTWTTISSLLQPQDEAAGAVANNVFYVLGGGDEYGPVDYVEALTP